MFWLFAMATTAGVIIGTPILFQALTGASPTPPATPDDLEDADARMKAARRAAMTAFAAFALVTGGLGGILALAFDPTDGIALIVAICLGLAGGAMHPEVLGSLRSSTN